MAEFDAFASGVTFGGLRNMLEIKVLVCYLLDKVHEPMSRKLLSECLQDTGLVNYFDLVIAVDELLADGIILGHDEDGEEYLTVTETGAENAKVLETSLLPFTRDKAVNAAIRIVARAKAEKENKVEITKTDTGYTIELAVMGMDEELMKLNLYCGDDLQAEALKEAFLADPSALYSVIIEHLTK